MSDLEAALSSILSSSEGIEQIKSVASMLGMNPNESKEEKSAFDGIDLNMILKLKELLSSNQNSTETQLLDALKPYLSENRVKKVDEAKKIMKIMKECSNMMTITIWMSREDGLRESQVQRSLS